MEDQFDELIEKIPHMTPLVIQMEIGFLRDDCLDAIDEASAEGYECGFYRGRRDERDRVY